jgi:hypothetical protein
MIAILTPAQTGALLAALLLAGCATSLEGPDGPIDLTRASIVDITSRGEPSIRVLRIQAGPIRVRHSIPIYARLGSTRLQGLDPGNSHLDYEFGVDGTFLVEESGRYRHSVGGSFFGRGRERIRSTLSYIELVDSAGR